MKLFIDTSGWIALFDRSDKYHAIAAQNWQRLRQEPVELFTSDYVHDETITHLLYKCGRHVAMEYGRWLLSTTSVTFVHIDQETWRLAWDFFQTYEDKSWAFTDCTSFVVMQQHQVWKAFTFDHHFEQAGFQLWPSTMLV